KIFPWMKALSYQETAATALPPGATRRSSSAFQQPGRWLRACDHLPLRRSLGLRPACLHRLRMPERRAAFRHSPGWPAQECSTAELPAPAGGGRRARRAMREISLRWKLLAALLLATF